MIKVGLLTTWDEKCGLAEYSKSLVASTRGVEFKIFGRETWHWPQLLKELEGAVQVLHVNHEPGLFQWLEPHMVSAVRAAGIKTLVTWHTSSEGNNQGALQNVFDRVVVHEKTTEGYQRIPMGIWRLVLPDTPPTWAIGTAGFPFSWKGFHPVAQASKLLGFGCMVIAPKSDHVDTEVMERFVMEAQPKTEYIKDWLSSEDVIYKLHSCQVNVFAYSGSGGGISGAVRFGISAKRPLVLSRCRQFRDLYDYEDEIEFIEGEVTAESVAAAVERVLKNKKQPKRVLEDMDWRKVAGEYKNEYQNLMGE